MNKIILFQCSGVLVDGQAMRRTFREKMAQVLSARYGKSPELWHSADEQIVAHWNDYHRDLNFSGEDGIEDIHEALFRVTRALFTITKTPEPPKLEITALAQELIRIPCHDVLYPGVVSAIKKCREKGYTTGVYSYFLEAQTGAITVDIPELAYVIGADTLNQYEHDAMFFRKLCVHLKTSADKIVLVSNSSQTLAIAKESGLQVIPVRQSPALLEQTLTHYLET